MAAILSMKYELRPVWICDYYVTLSCSNMPYVGKQNTRMGTGGVFVFACSIHKSIVHVVCQEFHQFMLRNMVS